MCKHEGGCTCKDDPYRAKKMNTISDFVDLVKDPDPELVSIDDVVRGIEEVEHSFGFIDSHMMRVYGDPFDAVAKIEKAQGGPLALCTTVITGPTTTNRIFTKRS